MNKPVFYITLLLCLCPFFVLAQQNLLYNGDFEIYDTCPDDLIQVERCDGWIRPTEATSDYYNRCSSSLTVGVPNHAIGFQDAQSGDAFMGILGYSKGFPSGEPPYLWIEYIQGIIDPPLQKDSLYFLSFYMNANNYINVANRNIGMYLSSDPISSNNTLPFYFTPQISTNEFIRDTLTWEKISGYYVASGDEKFVTIGAFHQANFIDTLTIEYTLPSFAQSYYYIDNASVINLEFHIPNIITNNHDGINDLIDFSNLPNGLELLIFNRWGGIVYQWTEETKFWIPDDLSEGTYFYVLLDKLNGKKVKTGFIQLVR